MNPKDLANLLTFSGYASILASIAIWASSGGQSKDAEAKAHGERFGIFVGLWAPTFFALASQARAAAEARD